MATTLQPTGELDATPSRRAALAVRNGVVNGPEGDLLGWDAVDWRAAEEGVRRLRQRIFTASRAGDLKKVRNLQKLLLRSRSNTLVSVRRVTQHNAGRKTPGVDGQVVLTDQGRAELAHWVQHHARPWHARPVKRVYIPKQGGKLRGLGIPVLVDRVLQARVLNALEPEWEARFEPKSYGFRPGRGCQDAIGAIYLTLKGKHPKRQWIVDADLAAAFDRIDHGQLLAALGGFPARGLIAAWLRAGVVDHGRLAPTLEGTPQGGVISPLLLNIALHGMEQAAGVRYHTTGTHAGKTVAGTPVLIRYADDLVCLCHSRQQAEQVTARLAAWLAPRGLAFNPAKTRIVHIDDGFDFLGFNVRRYHGKLLIKPSKAAIRRVREHLRTTLRSLRGAEAAAIPHTVNPIVRGWTAYYRTVVSSKVFDALDTDLWRLTYKWASYRHPNKSKQWVTARYFGTFHPTRQDRWVFGDRKSGVYLRKFSWTKIVRNQLVTGASSPDDPALAQYWADRRRKGPPPPLHAAELWQLRRQGGRCPLCGGFLLHADQQPQSPHQWEQWLTTTRKAIAKRHIVSTGPGTPNDHRPSLVHAHCHRRHPETGTGSDPALLPTREPVGLA
jgi:RNA-directed DNA polymerase